MDRTNEAAARPPHAPEQGPLPVPAIQVTPENVAELGAVFRMAAFCLEPHVRTLGQDLTLAQPWMHDAVSRWMRDFFNGYFIHDENSFTNVLRTAYEQHLANADALTRAAESYGRTEELRARTYELREQLGP